MEVNKINNNKNKKSKVYDGILDSEVKKRCHIYNIASYIIDGVPYDNNNENIYEMGTTKERYMKAQEKLLQNIKKHVGEEKLYTIITECIAEYTSVIENISVSIGLKAMMELYCSS